ncbi:MAG: DUF3820 family protein, partial [Schleiferiaceae bacterium]|nr:DUF3820 family protein [Schleiferiaceae bacterium]
MTVFKASITQLSDFIDRHYLVWFQRQGFPPGKLGMLLQTTLVIK